MNPNSSRHRRSPQGSPSVAFRVTEPVDVASYRLAFLDEWSQALAKTPLPLKKFRGRNLTEKIENLLYEHGWDGSWHTLLAQVHKHHTLRYEEHPVLRHLAEYNGIFWLAFWKSSRTQIVWQKEGAVWDSASRGQDTPIEDSSG